MKTEKPIGKVRLYNIAFKEKGREEVVLWDVFPIQNGDKMMVTFESSSSPWRQGIWLMTNKSLIVNSQQSKSVELWIDTAPRQVAIECFTDNGLLNIYNIWDSGRGYGTESQKFSSGMLVDELPNGRRYHCNDIGFNTNFDKLVFRIERIIG